MTAREDATWQGGQLAGQPIHAEVTSGDGVIWLHRVSKEHGLDSPKSLGGSSAYLMVTVDDVGAHFAAVRDAGARIEHEPTDMPYGVSEFAAGPRRLPLVLLLAARLNPKLGAATPGAVLTCGSSSFQSAPERERL